MSIDAELTAALDRIQNQVTAVAKSTDQAGSAIQRMLNQGSARARTAGTEMDALARKVQGVGANAMKAFGGFLGFGSVNQLIGTALGAVQQHIAERQRQHQERLDSATGYIGGTRGVLADAPQGRRVLEREAPWLTSEERLGMTRGYVAAGGRRDDMQMFSRMARSAQAAPALGWDPVAMARLFGRASAMGVQNPEDLIAALIDQHGPQADDALGRMAPARARALAGRSAGAFRAQIARPMDETDRLEMELRMLRAATDPRRASAEQQLEALRAERGRFTVTEAPPAGESPLETLRRPRVSPLQRVLDRVAPVQVEVINVSEPLTVEP